MGNTGFSSLLLSPFFFRPVEEWKNKERGEGIVKSPYSPKDQGKERAVCPLLALFFSFALFFFFPWRLEM